MRTIKQLLGATCLWALASSVPAVSRVSAQETQHLATAAAHAERQLRETFTSLTFDNFGPAPVSGPIYQANAGGRTVYYAPQSGHILFAAVYDRNGVNVTALAQDAAARQKLARIDLSDALVIGPKNAPSVIEFTDPDCPYCRALDRFWATREAQGQPVRRHIFFVTGIHPQAAAKAVHILCATDKAATFKAIYAGTAPEKLEQCEVGQTRLAAQLKTVTMMGVSGTPTLVLGSKLISGFQQGEIESFLEAAKGASPAAPRR